MQDVSHYKILSTLGEGSFAVVLKAQLNDNFSNTQSVTISTSQVPYVAIKKLKKKYSNWNDCINLREVKALKLLSHMNIIKLREVLREHLELYLVFDYCEYNLCQVIPYISSVKEMQSIIVQLISGIGFSHKYGYMHRDVKPENLLFCNENGQYILKVADFGLAREIRSKPPYTEYISTRWYRCPELLLKYKKYSSAIDIWSIGAVLAELHLKKPLFPGQSELDQLFKISSVIPPDWDDAKVLSKSIGFAFPIPTTNLCDVLQNKEITEFVQLCLLFDPVKRPNCSKLINSKFVLDFLKIGIEIDSDFNMKNMHLLPELKIKKERTNSITRNSVISVTSKQRTPMVTANPEDEFDDMNRRLDKSSISKTDIRKSTTNVAEPPKSDIRKSATNIEPAGAVSYLKVQEQPVPYVTRSYNNLVTPITESEDKKSNSINPRNDDNMSFFSMFTRKK